MVEGGMPGLGQAGVWWALYRQVGGIVEETQEEAPNNHGREKGEAWLKTHEKGWARA